MSHNFGWQLDITLTVTISIFEYLRTIIIYIVIMNTVMALPVALVVLSTKKKKYYFLDHSEFFFNK